MNAPRLISVMLRALLLVAALGRSTPGQTGRIIGTVTDRDGLPLAGAQAVLLTLGLSAESGRDGRFTISNVPAGRQSLRVFRIGYAPSPPLTIDVPASQVSTFAVTLDATPLELQSIVVTGSRRPEKITESPATITALDVNVIQDRIGSTYGALLKEAKGLDVTQVGVTAALINGRGFNKLLNARWLTLEDGRIAQLAELGLPIGEWTTIPKLDVADVEVIVGPGSALYGANASGGLMSVQTKDPRRFSGWSLDLAGGTRDLHDEQLRYAGSRGHWGYKASGEYQTARDWTDTLFYSNPGGKPLPETATDFTSRITRGSGSLIYYLDDGARLQLNAGSSLRNGLGQNAAGHYQIANYRYQDYQLEYASGTWFAQTYMAHSNSGDTYLLTNFTQTGAKFPNLSADSVRTLAAFPVDARTYAAELQHNGTVASVLHTGAAWIDNTRVTLGTQVSRARVSSYGRVYTDALTGKPLFIDQGGLYGQAESPLTPALRLVLAGRYDKSGKFARQFSPKVGLLVSPLPDETFRLTYNRAYLSPTVFQTDQYVLNRGASTVTIGNAGGFDVKNAAGAVIDAISPLEPETNETWELGYKAVVAGRLSVDVTGYRSRFTNFISSQVVIANPFAASPTRAYDHRTGVLMADPSGNPLQTRTSINVGVGIFDGIDAGLRYLAASHVALSGNISLARLDTIKSRPSDPPDASQFNTSSNRTSLALEAIDIPTHATIRVATRYVNGYSFRSAVDWGRIPTYGTLDISANYRLPAAGTTLTLQAQNVASCLGGTSTPPLSGISAVSQATYTPGQHCAFGLRHHELINMPAIGTMIFVGARGEWR